MTWFVTRDSAWRCEHDDCNIAVFKRKMLQIGVPGVAQRCFCDTPVQELGECLPPVRAPDGISTGQELLSGTGFLAMLAHHAGEDQ